MYYIYRTDKKIGLTNNIENRIEKIQGIKNYDIIYKTECIKTASNFEIQLQKKYNYKIDQTNYLELTIKKNINMYYVSTQTVTFKNSNFENLSLMIPETIVINGNTIIVDNNIKNWILNNNHKSRQGENRFIYIEKFLNFIEDYKSDNIYDKIRVWAKEKGIYEKGDPKTQYLKLQEECGELAKAILQNNDEEVIDAIGDCVVVLTNLSKLCGFKIEDCIESAYSVIKNRTGKMENGTFVKDK
jgi:NTP pyrophosphatase (non-canonical NTP hydrolase)